MCRFTRIFDCTLFFSRPINNAAGSEFSKEHKRVICKNCLKNFNYYYFFKFNDIARGRPLALQVRDILENRDFFGGRFDTFRSTGSRVRGWYSHGGNNQQNMAKIRNVSEFRKVSFSELQLIKSNA